MGLGPAPGSGVTITGIPQLDRKLLQMERVAVKRVGGKGIRAGLTVFGKAMRTAINASDASPELKREARKTIGQRFTHQLGAKVGFSVGKKKAIVAKAKAARVTRIGVGKSKGKGVGVSSPNVHWFVLGTYKAAGVGTRRLKKGSEKGPKAGHPTGLIADVFGQVTRQTMATSGPAALAAARAKISVEIEKEALKRV